MKKTMLDYIKEEQAVLTNVINGLTVDKMDFRNVKHCLLLATGSSYNACLAAKYYMETVAPIYVEIEEPFNYLHYGKVDPKIDVVIAVSQSGKSSSTIDAVSKITLANKIKTFALTSDLQSPIAEVVNDTIDLNIGIEKVGFVTKGYSATVLNLMLLSLAIAKQNDCIEDSELVEEKNKIQTAVNQIDKSIQKAQIFFEKNQETLKEATRFVAIGYGPNWGTAKEFETKFTETVRQPTQGFELEAYMHGPYLEANERHVLFFIESDSKLRDRSRSLARYMEPYVKKCYAITTFEDERSNILSLDTEVEEKLSPLLLIVPIQYLASQIAALQGIDLSIRIFDDFDDILKSKR